MDLGKHDTFIIVYIVENPKIICSIARSQVKFLNDSTICKPLKKTKLTISFDIRIADDKTRDTIETIV